MLDPLVVGLHRKVERIVHQRTVEARRCLPARLGRQFVAGQPPAVGGRHVDAVGDHVDVLPHRIETRLDAGHVIEGILARQADFRAAVETRVARSQQLGPSETGIEREMFIHHPGVAQVEGRFQRLLPVHIHAFDLRQEAEGMIGPRIQVVLRGVDAVAERMGVAERQREIQLCEILIDGRIERIGLILVERVPDSVVVAVVANGSCHRMPVVKDAVPLQRAVDVPVMESGVPAETELVAREVAICVDRIAVADLLADAQIDILERSPAAAVIAVGRQEIENPVGIGRTSAQDEGRAVLHQRSFQMQTARQQTQTQGTLHLLAVAVAAADLQHGRDAAAILGRNRALVEFHVVDHVGIEQRQDAEHMVRIVDRPFVEQDEVLVGRTAAHVEAAGSLAHRLDTRQGKHHLQGVSLAEGHRHVLDQVDAHLLDAHM